MTIKIVGTINSVDEPIFEFEIDENGKVNLEIDESESIVENSAEFSIYGDLEEEHQMQMLSANIEDMNFKGMTAEQVCSKLHSDYPAIDFESPRTHKITR